jgi:hypothetical protein
MQRGVSRCVEADVYVCNLLLTSAHRPESCTNADGDFEHSLTATDVSGVKSMTVFVSHGKGTWKGAEPVELNQGDASEL